jgi:dTDP-4-amino-4,6-dideoxygalactose transaminase
VRATDLQAQIGLSQMKKLAPMFARRIENHAFYQRRIAESRYLVCQQNPEATICSISFMALAATVEHREKLGVALRENGIETRPVGGGNMSRQPFWSSRYGDQVFPVADALHDCAFQLPNHPGLSLCDIEEICKVVLAVEV